MTRTPTVAALAAVVAFLGGCSGSPAERSAAPDAAPTSQAVPTVEVKYFPREAGAECQAPCYDVGFVARGFTKGSYTASWRTTGARSAVCNSADRAYGFPRTFTVDAGEEEVRAGWFISGTCTDSVSSVKVDPGGVTGKQVIP